MSADVTDAKTQDNAGIATSKLTPTDAVHAWSSERKLDPVTVSRLPG